MGGKLAAATNREDITFWWNWRKLDSEVKDLTEAMWKGRILYLAGGHGKDGDGPRRTGQVRQATVLTMNFLGQRMRSGVDGLEEGWCGVWAPGQQIMHLVPGDH